MSKVNRDVCFNNPSYDKSLSFRDRLGDFMGKYHVVLNGVVKHDPYVRAEEDGGGMCCQSHKIEILDFVDDLLREIMEEMPEKFEDYDDVDFPSELGRAYDEGFNDCHTK